MGTAHSYYLIKTASPPTPLRVANPALPKNL